MKRVFIELGKRLSDFGRQEEVIRAASRANGWFTADDILYAVDAIRDKMLDETRLSDFVSTYNLPVATVRNVGVIMAGNIPLVGLFDMMCVLLSGHKCYVKPSSKDKVLTDFIIQQLLDIAPDIPLHYLDRQSLDAVIATGSSNTSRYFRSRFRDLPALIRGNRSSVAILRGRETRSQLSALAEDIFRYSGLGCRNVSMIFMPADYDAEVLRRELAAYTGSINPKYRNNYLQRRAMLTMNGVRFLDGDFFVLTEGDDLSPSISEIVCRRYDSPAHLAVMLDGLEEQLQCVVSDGAYGIAFGEAQRPELTDFADGVDPMLFLTLL